MDSSIRMNVRRPGLLTECASRYGSQCIVLATDAKQIAPDKWEVYVSGGRTPTGIDAVAWAVESVEGGPGGIPISR